MRLSHGLAGLGTALVTVATASAHPSGHVSPTESFAAGFAHPLLGFDHLLAMFTVGLLAVQRGGKAIWTYPLAFVGAMVTGCLLPMLPAIITESGIVLSMVGLGFFVVLSAVRAQNESGKRDAILLPVHIFGIFLFGLFHGHAHGTEMPAAFAFTTYGIGFTLATALLHASGIAIGSLLLISHRAPFAFRALGTLVMAIGFLTLINN